MSSPGDIVASIPVWVDVTSVALGASAGALVAVRRGFDVNGVLLLAIVTGLGGGIIRDTLLQRGTPVALTSPWLLPSAIVTGVIVFLFVRAAHWLMNRLNLTILVVDAVFLGVYAIAGTAKALDARLPAVSCVFVGVLAGVGGGILRDVLVNEQPVVLRPGTFYSLSAIVGCTFLAVAVRLGHATNWIGLPAIAVVVGLRLLSEWRRWESPAAPDLSRTIVIRPQTVRRRRRDADTTPSPDD